MRWGAASEEDREKLRAGAGVMGVVSVSRDA
jgi:hypothetical protein